MNETATGWVLEVLDRGGRVLRRVWTQPGVLRVGRALDNDVVLDDPFVDAHHLDLVVTPEGVHVEDRDSMNGTWLAARRRVRHASLSDGQKVQVGHSTLRLRSPAASVPPAWRDATSHGWVSVFRRPLVLFACLVLAILALGFDAWVEETRSLSAGILANQLAYPILGLLFWAALWSGMNRVSSHQPNFGVHLGIGALALAGLFIGDQGVRLLAFAFDWHDAAPWGELGAEITVIGLALFAHLQYIAHGRRSLQALGAVVVSAVLIGSPALGDWLRRDDFNSLPALNPLLKPPAARLVEGQSIEGFLDQAERFRDDLRQE